MSNRTKAGITKSLKGSLMVLFLFCQAIGISFAQSVKPQTSNLDLYEDTLKVLGDSVLHGSGDAVRESANRIFKATLERALKDKESFQFTFDSVKTLGKETAPDNAFRIYSWIMPKHDGTDYSYYGFVQTFDRKKNELKLFPLVDSSKTLVNPQSLKLRSDNWYGALYYKILKHKKGGKYYYTLLGWHGKNQITIQKLIDVIYFNSGKPMFGYPLFKTEKVYKSRIIFEYTAHAVMSLKYEEGKKLIVFDHLSSSSQEMENSTSGYGPDGSYDAFQFKGGHWLYMKDVDVRTGWEPKKQPKSPPPHEPPIQNGE